VQLLVRDDTVALPLKGIIDLAAEKARLEKEMAKAAAEISRIDTKLSNPDFIARAKEEVVEADREKREETLSRQAKIAEALERLRQWSNARRARRACERFSLSPGLSAAKSGKDLANPPSPSPGFAALNPGYEDHRLYGPTPGNLEDRLIRKDGLPSLAARDFGPSRPAAQADQAPRGARRHCREVRRPGRR